MLYYIHINVHVEVKPCQIVHILAECRTRRLNHTALRFAQNKKNKIICHDILASAPLSESVS